jgi:hypothetical protein
VAKDRGRDRDREVEDVDNGIKALPIAGARDALHRSGKDPVRFCRSQSLNNNMEGMRWIEAVIQTLYAIFKDTMQIDKGKQTRVSQKYPREQEPQREKLSQDQEIGNSSASQPIPAPASGVP